MVRWRTSSGLRPLSRLSLLGHALSPACKKSNAGGKERGTALSRPLSTLPAPYGERLGKAVRISYEELCEWGCVETGCKPLTTARYDLVVAEIAPPRLGTVLDATYGRGRMWRRKRPTRLVAVDIVKREWDVKPDLFIEGDFCAVWREAWKAAGSVDALAFDPPFPGYVRGRETFREELGLRGKPEEVAQYVKRLYLCFLEAVREIRPRWLVIHAPVPVRPPGYSCSCWYVPKGLLPFARYGKRGVKEPGEPASYWLVCEREA